MGRSACVLALVACAACQDLPSVIWRGKRLDYAAYDSDAATLCEGTLAFADAKAEAIAQRLGVDSRVPFYWLPDWAGGSPCPPLRSGGCESRGKAYAKAPISDHEVVHALVSSFGRPDPFLAEGLAEYLGGHGTAHGFGDPSELYGVGRGDHDPTYYPTAGRFVGRVIEWSSLADLLALYRANDWPDDAAHFEALLEKYTGVRAGEVRDSFVAEPSCGSLAYREDPIGCSGTPLPFDNAPGAEPLEVVAELDCASSDVTGREGAMQWRATIEVAEAGLSYVTVSPETNAFVIPCAPGCAAGDAMWVANTGPAPDPERQLWLNAGRYQVILRRATEGMAQVTFD